MDISNEAIGSRIRQTRKERGYTRERLAELSEMSTDFIDTAETGKNNMKVQSLAKVATALNVTTDFLIFGTSPYNDNPKINLMIASLPDKKRKQIEKLITLFAEAIVNDDDNVNADKK